MRFAMERLWPGACCNYVSWGTLFQPETKSGHIRRRGRPRGLTTLLGMVHAPLSSVSRPLSPDNNRDANRKEKAISVSPEGEGYARGRTGTRPHQPTRAVVAGYSSMRTITCGNHFCRKSSGRSYWSHTKLMFLEEATLVAWISWTRNMNSSVTSDHTLRLK
jgi:hypothetical protein